MLALGTTTGRLRPAGWCGGGDGAWCEGSECATRNSNKLETQSICQMDGKVRFPTEAVEGVALACRAERDFGCGKLATPYQSSTWTSTV
jgi:hypothetical protein